MTRAREEGKRDEARRTSFLRKTFLEVPTRASFFAFQYTTRWHPMSNNFCSQFFFGHSVHYMASNVENLLSWVLWKVPLRKVRYMNHKLKLDKWFFWKIWEPRLCFYLFFEWSLILCTFVSPDSLKQNSNWLGQVYTAPFFFKFQLIFWFAIRFCFRLAYYTILTVKVKQGTLKTVEASKSDQKQEMW